MNKNYGAKFELQRQQIRQQTELHREQRLEEGNLYVYQFRERDVPLTEQGRADARSLSIQIGKWKETLSEDEQDGLFMFTSTEDALDEFSRYITTKYKGARREDWIKKLADQGYRQDVERMFYSKIYDHKYKLRSQGIEEAFASPRAQNQITTIQLQRFVSTSAHEAVGRYSKVAKNNPELVQHPEEAKKMIATIVREVLTEEGLGRFTQLVQPLPEYKTAIE